MRDHLTADLAEAAQPIGDLDKTVLPRLGDVTVARGGYPNIGEELFHAQGRGGRRDDQGDGHRSSDEHAPLAPTHVACIAQESGDLHWVLVEGARSGKRHAAGEETPLDSGRAVSLMRRINTGSTMREAARLALAPMVRRSPRLQIP